MDAQSLAREALDRTDKVQRLRENVAQTFVEHWPLEDFKAADKERREEQDLQSNYCFNTLRELASLVLGVAAEEQEK